MIYEKELLAPTYRRRSLRRRLSLFKEEDGCLLAHGLHFRASSKGICCAEGVVKRGELVPEEVPLVSTGHTRDLFTYVNNLVLRDGVSYPVSERPKQILSYCLTEGKPDYYALLSVGCVQLHAAGGHGHLADGADCGLVLGERIFLAKGSRLQWTKPFSPMEEEHSLHGRGEVWLPSENGDIHSLAEERGVLYAFRDRGITRLAVYGDELNFRASELPYAGGKIYAGTVQPCGDRVLFLSESGLYSLRNGKCEPLYGCGEGFLDFTGTSTASAGGKYYATVRYRGEECLWCVEPSLQRGHLIRLRADGIAGGEELYFTAEGTLYALTERGLPLQRRRECALKTEYSLLGLSSRNKFLDGVTVEGSGNFRIEARGEHGAPCAVCGRAGEPLRFPRPVRGTGFTLDIRTVDAGACIRSLVFDLREETQW